MDISRRTLAVLVAAFVIGGLGFYSLVTNESSKRISDCKAYCEAQGKRAVALPAGTAGQTVESGYIGDWRHTEANKCQCVAVKQ